ncbi:MAG TPA: hypothetical protein VJR04_07305 [Terriglobales bacterium]|nr:hypothetical protein [Terriglobales bacterium]
MINESAVTSGMPKASAVAPINLSAGSRGYGSGSCAAIDTISGVNSWMVTPELNPSTAA